MSYDNWKTTDPRDGQPDPYGQEPEEAYRYGKFAGSEPDPRDEWQLISALVDALTASYPLDDNPYGELLEEAKDRIEVKRKQQKPK